jgi:hypothetical protein
MDPPLSVEELIRELDEPNLTDWKLISYKCFSHFPNISLFELNIVNHKLYFVQMEQMVLNVYVAFSLVFRSMQN